MVFLNAKWLVEETFRNKENLDIRKKGHINQVNEEHPQEFRNFHTLYRMKFIAGKKGKCILRYSADDIAKVYINGNLIDFGPAPSYHFSYGYMELNISDFLNEGMNVLCAHLYYQGELNRAFTSGDFRTGFIAEVVEDEKIIAVTDENVKCIKSEAYDTDTEYLYGYRTQYQEFFKAEKWDYQWLDLKYDDSHWDNASIKSNNDHVFARQETKALQLYDVYPVSQRIIDEETVLYDLGCEFAGVPSFDIKGKKGDLIEIRCAEELDENQRARYKMRCNCNYELTHTVSGAINEQTEFFDYIAYRYFEIKLPPTTTISNVRISARNYPFDEKSTSFTSNNNLLNQIFDICKNGVRCGTQEGYLDCPTREKGLYLGDMTITAQSHFYLTGDLSILKRALKGFAQTTYFYEGIDGTCYNHFTHPLVDYSFQFPLNLLMYYKHSNDKEFLREMVPYCERMFAYYEAFEKDGLLYDITDTGHLVDWPRTPYDFTDGYDYDLERFKTTKTHNIANAFHIGGRKNMNEIYDILEIKYEDRVPYLTEKYIDAFYDAKTKLFTDTIESSHSALHSNVIPLYYGIVPDEAKESILNLIKKKRLHCGVYIAYFLLKALASLDEHKLIYDLITGDDLFSWSTMIKEGASTCFEVWGKELKWNTSLCHPWASAPIILIIEDLLGVSPVEPGWKEGYTTAPKLQEGLAIDIEFQVNGYKIALKEKK